MQNYRTNKHNRTYSLDNWHQHYFSLTEKSTLLNVHWAYLYRYLHEYLLMVRKLSSLSLKDPSALRDSQYLLRHEKTSCFLKKIRSKQHWKQSQIPEPVILG